MLTPIDAVIHKLHLIKYGSCTCRKQWQPVERHASGCRYRLLDELEVELPMALFEVVLGAQESAIDRVLSGVHRVSPGFNHIPFTGCPPDWMTKTFANIVWYEESRLGRCGWILAPDQTGTVVADLARRM